MKISELPQVVQAKALKHQKEEKSSDFYKDTDNLNDAFDWTNTKDGSEYWCILHTSKNIGEAQEKAESLFFVNQQLAKDKIKPLEAPSHYDNTKGSLYLFCEAQGLNNYEFDAIKRIMRCRKKGNFIEDLEKTKFLIDLYIQEQAHLHENQTK